MTFKGFKEIVLDYFYSHSMVQKKYVKKSLKFKKSKILGFNVNFIFAGKNINLYYRNGYWIISTRLACYYKTINDCCDCLWQVLGGEINI